MNSFDDIKPLKIIVIGNSEVGKSSLITRFFDKRFGNAVKTIGVDYRVMKNILVQSGHSYQVSIWDTAG
jgi:small GTP-binding protein